MEDVVNNKGIKNLLFWSKLLENPEKKIVSNLKDPKVGFLAE